MEQLLNLVASLSPAEKRQFKLANKKSAVPGAYLFLFNLIEKNKYADWISIKTAFITRHPAASIDSASNYLYKLVLEALVQNKVKNDDAYKLWHSLLQIKILKDRNLHGNAYAEIKRSEKLAEKYQELPILYLLKREELNYLSDGSYTSIKEKELIAKQGAAKDVLRDIKNIHDHHTLYELLKHRLNNSSQILSEKNKTELNDLVFSEIAIINTNTKQTVESKKLHLLFQSFYFIKTGDYRSALRTFHILNELYESGSLNLQHPPVDYYSMLDGILDSLRMIDHYEEMDYFVKKIDLLDKKEYPEYFRLLIKKASLLSQLRIAAYQQKWSDALGFIKNTEADVIRRNVTINQHKQIELLFYVSLVYFKSGQLNKAIKAINNIILIKHVDYTALLYRIARLFNVVMNYEARDLAYLDYEIRSYKRIFKGNIKMLSVEKFVFNVVKINPRQLSKYNSQLQWEKLASLHKSIVNNKYESQLLKYFDFLGWAKELFKLG